MSFDQVLSFAIVVPAALFAGVLTWLNKDARPQNSYMTYLLEAVTIEASIVVILSAFSPRLLAWLADNPVLLLIVAMTTLLYALRDMFGRTRGDAAQKHRRNNV